MELHYCKMQLHLQYSSNLQNIDIQVKQSNMLCYTASLKVSFKIEQ